MSVIYIILPLALIMATVAVIGFYRAVNMGQVDVRTGRRYHFRFRKDFCLVHWLIRLSLVLLQRIRRSLNFDYFAMDTLHKWNHDDVSGV